MPKRKRGRPKLPRQERQDAALLLRMRPAELDAVRRLARDQGTTPGVAARALLRKHLRRKGYLPKPPP